MFAGLLAYEQGGCEKRCKQAVGPLFWYVMNAAVGQSWERKVQRPLAEVGNWPAKNGAGPRFNVSTAALRRKHLGPILILTNGRSTEIPAAKSRQTSITTKYEPTQHSYVTPYHRFHTQSPSVSSRHAYFPSRGSSQPGSAVPGRAKIDRSNNSRPVASIDLRWCQAGCQDLSSNIFGDLCVF